MRKWKSDAFEKDTVAPQFDCVSASLYILSCKSTGQQPAAHITNDHQYAYINDEINLNMEYADDMSHISPDMKNIEYTKKTLQSKLSSWDLIMNEEKTEEFAIKRNGEWTWKKCKLLGTLLDTEEDVKRKKVLAMNVVNLMKKIFFGDISIEVKVHSFN